MSTFRSAALISIAFAAVFDRMIATVAAEVWMRPCDSVSGTRCTRWVPDSNFSLEYAPRPSTRAIDFLVAAMLAGAGRFDFDLPALALGDSARTCGTGRRRRSRPRRHRCRRGLRDRCCPRRARPSAAGARAVRRRVARACAWAAAISSSASSRISGSDRIASAATRSACARRLVGECRRRPVPAARTRARNCGSGVVADHAGIGEQAFEFLAAFDEGFEFAAQGGDHGPEPAGWGIAETTTQKRCRLANSPRPDVRCRWRPVPIPVAGNSLSAARARSLSPSSAASRSATVGACSRRLVRVCARKSSTACGSWPRPVAAAPSPARPRGRCRHARAGA